MLTCSMMRFISLLLLGLFACVVFLGLYVRLSCCECGCCGDCDACIVICVACVYAARLLGHDGDGNAGVWSGGGVAAVSAYMGGTRGSGVWLLQVTL